MWSAMKSFPQSEVNVSSDDAFGVWYGIIDCTDMYKRNQTWQK